jgi:hypothetical protein
MITNPSEAVGAVVIVLFANADAVDEPAPPPPPDENP